MGFGMRGTTTKVCGKENTVKSKRPHHENLPSKRKKKQKNSTSFPRICKKTRKPLSNLIQLYLRTNRDHSRRYFMSMLQQNSSAWDKVVMMMRRRTKDMAAQETLRERWEAIESGKLRGRRLFLPMEEGESEVRSLSFCYSDDESSGSKGQHHCTLKCAYSSSSSSSSPCMFGSSADKGHEVKRVKDSMAAVEERRLFIGMSGNGGRYAVFLGGFTFALLIIAICMSSVMRSSGGCDHEAVLVPT